MRWALLAALLCLAGCTDGGVQSTPAGDVVPAASRLAAPGIEGTLLGGGDLDADSLDQRITVLNFWGSWCGPCRVEGGEFSALAGEFADEPVSFLGVDLRDEEQPAQAFLADRSISYPSISDPRGEVALAFADYPISRTPSTLLIDADGRVAAVYPGPVTGDDLRQALRTLLAEQ